MSRKYFIIALILLTSLFLTACNNSDNDGDDLTAFEWWITDTDGRGTYYEKYEENIAIQWINNQTWNPETGGYTKDGTGKKT